MQQYVQGNRSNKLLEHVTKIQNNTRIHASHNPPNCNSLQVLDTLKQKLWAQTSRLRRYIESRQRGMDNALFVKNEKKFYRDLQNKQAAQIQSVMPVGSSLESFWSSIWSSEAIHNRNAHWIDSITNPEIPPMPTMQIDEVFIRQVIQKTHNWKSPGTDGIHNYRYKKLTYTHKYIAQHLQHFMHCPSDMPEFMTEGVTYLLSKNADTSNPANYRPITCLQTLYKILTSCFAHKVQIHIAEHNILAEQQNGCRPDSRGCKEQLIIDSVVLRQAALKNRNLSTMFIDYKKAFDSVPHSWLMDVLKMYKIDSNIIQFLSHALSRWRTTLHLTSNNKRIVTNTIAIKRGIYQGDSFSPLWFCLALNPLSALLNSTGHGYALKDSGVSLYTISHLMYMDDIKLYASSQNQLKQLFEIVKMFSSDIKMEFGLDKCRTQHFNKGKRELVGFELEDGRIVEPMDDSDSYKYLGFQQARQIEHSVIKTELTRKYKNRVNKVLATQLNSRNITKAINTFAVPILTYSFGIIRWTQTDLVNIQRATRVLFTKHRKHHPKSSLERFTIPRKLGGRGITDIIDLHYSQLSNLREYFFAKATISLLHQAVVAMDSEFTPLKLKDPDYNPAENVTILADKISQWASKSLHGRFNQELSQPDVDKNSSNKWLVLGELYPETEGFMMAIQDQVVNTRNYRKHILLENMESDICRRCNKKPETIHHIISSCCTLTQSDYLLRHNQIVNIIHQELAVKYKFLVGKMPYYKYNGEIVLDNATHTIYLDRSIITDHTIPNNRPDITLRDKSNSTTYFIDVAVPNTHNLSTTYSEKLRKYAELAIEIQQQWQMSQVIIVPVVISATGVIPSTLHKSLKILDIQPNIYITIQKAAILNTTRTVRKFLSC